MKRRIPTCDPEPLPTADGVVRYDSHPFFDRIFWAYGFRPFFLASACYAALSALAWAVFWLGPLELPSTIPAVGWHAHEMIFGALGAAICGFLLTAVPEWTGTPPRTGRWLALLIGLWLVGRAAMWFAAVLPLPLVAGLNFLLFPVLAVWIVPALWRDPNRRHRSFIAVVPMLALAQVLVFLGWLDWVELDFWAEDLAQRALNAGLHVFLIAIVLTVTRVSMVLVPLALDEQGDEDSRFMPIPPRRNLATATLIMFAIADFVAPDNAVTGWVALAAATAQLDRMADWHVGRVLLKPYVLTIYIAYAWLAAGLAGLGFANLFGGDDFAAARHALTMGAAGTALMAVFMVAGLRHTGRDVVLPRLAVAAVVFVSCATALRCLTPLFWPEQYAMFGIGAAAVVWSMAMAAYLVPFAPYLLRPRVDGMPG